LSFKFDHHAYRALKNIECEKISSINELDGVKLEGNQIFNLLVEGRKA